MPDKKPSLMYRIIKKGVHIVYPKTTVCGTENLPDEPVMFVGNHCQLHGPIVSELYMPVERYTWCAAQMMELREVPGYAFEDFWSHKPKYTHWFYRLLSYAIAPLSVIVFNNADTIPVYRDHRLMTTFRETLARLCEGRSVVIFPEHDPMKNNILAEFQEGFVDIARLYYRKTGKCVAFVPTYFAPNLHSVHFGRPLMLAP